MPWPGPLSRAGGRSLRPTARPRGPSPPGYRSGRIAFDVPSTLPSASLARTATYAAASRTRMRVSKPRRAAVATGVSESGESPASTSQLRNPVAPLKLAWTVRPPSVAASAGASPGVPANAKR